MLQLINNRRATHPFVAEFLAGFLAIASCSACAASDGASDSSEFPEDGTGGTSTQGEPPGLPANSLEFASPQTLALAPRQVTTLSVRVSPPSAQTVTFDILTDDTAFDGFLLQATAVVNANGVAEVGIQAPSQAAIFVVRASIGAELKATRTVSVSESYGQLLVSPRYQGTRPIEKWTVSARSGKTCEEIESYFVDGPLAAEGHAPVSLGLVPTGVTLAVTVRGDELVSGCIALDEVASGDPEAIVVEVKDRPINVERGELELVLGVDSLTTGYAMHLEEAIDLGPATFRGTESDDAGALIFRMQKSLQASDQAEFETKSASADFVGMTRTLFEASEPISNGLVDLLNGAAATIQGEETFRGTLTLAGTESVLALSEVTGLSPEVAGFTDQSGWPVSPESAETVIVGGSLSYKPLMWLSSLSSKILQAEESISPTAYLAEHARCIEVAEALTAASGGQTHGSCGVECVEQLCEEALTMFWTKDIPLAGTETTLSVGGSGEVDLSGAAQIDSISGTWVGAKDADETSLGGTLSAQLPQ